MAIHRPAVFAFLVLAFSLVARLDSACAQSFEDQAKAILEMYNAGNKDTAYALIEPLKRTARFVPAVLFARAEMTPDDRALNLYREIIALEPGGAYADEACAALIARYVEKLDSAGANAWLNVMKTNYPRSSLLAQSTLLVSNTHEWIDFDAGSRSPRSDTTSAAAKSDSSHSPPKESSSTVRGYALQVGLFPTRDAADRRVAELKAAGLNPSAFPKMIAGKRNYAVVVGPYASIDDANKHKANVAKICGCKAFIVKVQ